MASRRIVADPKVAAGKPRIEGTRITVEFILERLAAGWTLDDVLEAYPELSRDDIEAALLFAADLTRTAAVEPTTVP